MVCESGFLFLILTLLTSPILIAHAHFLFSLCIDAFFFGTGAWRCRNRMNARVDNDRYLSSACAAHRC